MEITWMKTQLFQNRTRMSVTVYKGQSFALLYHLNSTGYIPAEFTLYNLFRKLVVLKLLSKPFTFLILIEHCLINYLEQIVKKHVHFPKSNNL